MRAKTKQNEDYRPIQIPHSFTAHCTEMGSTSFLSSGFTKQKASKFHLCFWVLKDYAKYEYVLHNNNAANQWKRNCSDFWIMCQSNPRWMFLKKEINNYCVRDASSQCGAYHDKFFKLNQNIEIGISFKSKNLENQNVFIWYKSQHGMC